MTFWKQKNIWLISTTPRSQWVFGQGKCILTAQKKCSSSTWDAPVCDNAASANCHLYITFESVVFWNSLDKTQLHPRDLSSLVLALTQLIFEKCLSNQTVWGSCASQSQNLFGFQLLPGVSGPTGGNLKEKNNPLSGSGSFNVIIH